MTGQAANITVTFRHTESTDALKNYAIEKVSHALGKFGISGAEVHVILSCEKRDHAAEVKLHGGGFDVTGRAVTEDLYSAIDKVIDNVTTQLRKQKERSTDYKQHPAADSAS